MGQFEKHGSFIFKKMSIRNGDMQASSSNGRASDSKSGCWGFESLLACQKLAILNL